VVLLVSSQTLIDQGVTMLYAVEADADDPRPLLLTIPGLPQRPHRIWLPAQPAASYGMAAPAVLEQLDALLRVALDL